MVTVVSIPMNCRQASIEAPRRACRSSPPPLDLFGTKRPDIGGFQCARGVTSRPDATAESGHWYHHHLPTAGVEIRSPALWLPDGGLDHRGSGAAWRGSPPNRRAPRIHPAEPGTRLLAGARPYAWLAAMGTCGAEDRARRMRRSGQVWRPRRRGPAMPGMKGREVTRGRLSDHSPPGPMAAGRRRERVPPGLR